MAPKQTKSMPFDPEKLPSKLRARLVRCKEQVTTIDIALQGSVTERWMPCGKRGCCCQADPPRLHGPYYQWTAKVDGRTKTLRLKPDEVEAFRIWIDEGRRLDEIVRQWRSLSLEAVERSRGKSRG
jgi:hypothetical protein